MIALFLLLSAQAPAAAPADTPPPASPPAAKRVCSRAPGSDTITCRPAQENSAYRLPTYGPAAPGARSGSGDGVKVRAQASNKGRRKRSMATVGIPF